jgi:hypothetical protein
MNRIECDNALLASCDRVHKGVALVAALTGAGIGCFWYLCVAVKAGVFS